MLPTNPAERKATPITTGVLDYFPDAIAEIARVSLAGNEQHNPGEPLHWAREKSTDQADCIVRHLLERGSIDTDGMRHSAKMAWRALALLQLELEAADEEWLTYLHGGLMTKPSAPAAHASEPGTSGKDTDAKACCRDKRSRT